MGESKTGDVWRFDWITLLPVGQNLFKLVSNSGTLVEQVHGTEAENVRDWGEGHFGIHVAAVQFESLREDEPDGLPSVLVFRLSYAGSRH